MCRVARLLHVVRGVLFAAGAGIGELGEWTETDGRRFEFLSHTFRVVAVIRVIIDPVMRISLVLNIVLLLYFRQIPSCLLLILDLLL